jgi:hypothetical protein
MLLPGRLPTLSLSSRWIPPSADIGGFVGLYLGQPIPTQSRSSAGLFW